MSSLSSKHPLLILKELEDCFSDARTESIARSRQSETAWIGLGIRIGEFECLIQNNYIAEILLPDNLNNISRVPGTKAWFSGLISLRGQALPIIDLHRFFFGISCKSLRDSRILVLNFLDFTTGVIISRTLGLHRTGTPRFSASSADFPDVYKVSNEYFSRQIEINQRIWPILDVARLGKNPDFRNMAG